MSNIIKNGKRSDKRTLDELRPLKMEVGVVKRADGSAYVEMGKTKAIATVYGPSIVHPRHLENPEKAVLRCKYNMMPFSVNDRKRPGPDRRSVEIAKVVTEALTPTLYLEEFPKTVIDIQMEITQADAGTRVAAINAASLALADAGIPMKDLVTAVAAGRVEGNIALDLTKEEEDVDDAIDLPVAMMPRSGKVTLLQMDGDATPEDIEKIVRLAEKGCNELYEAQRHALEKKYK